MYEYLRGKLISRKLDYIVLDVNGVGFAIKMGSNLQSQLSDESQILVYCSLQVRDNSQELFGFATEEQKQLFETLLSVSGVGPKSAMKIISEVPTQDFALAILKSDSKKLNKEFKISPKLSERLVVELKDRINKLNISYKDDKNTKDSPDLTNSENILDSQIEDIFNALLVLGYSDSEIRKMIKNFYDKSLSLEENIQHILRNRNLSMLK